MTGPFRIVKAQRHTVVIHEDGVLRTVLIHHMTAVPNQKVCTKHWVQIKLNNAIYHSCRWVDYSNCTKEHRKIYPGRRVHGENTLRRR